MSSVTKQKYHSKYYGTIGWPGLWQALHCDNLWNLCLWKASKQCFLCGYSLGWVTMAGPPPVLRSVSSLHGISFCFPCSFFISFLLILEVHLPCPALPTSDGAAAGAVSRLGILGTAVTASSPYLLWMAAAEEAGDGLPWGGQCCRLAFQNFLGIFEGISWSYWSLGPVWLMLFKCSLQNVAKKCLQNCFSVHLRFVHFMSP